MPAENKIDIEICIGFFSHTVIVVTNYIPAYQASGNIKCTETDSDGDSDHGLCEVTVYEGQPN